MRFSPASEFLAENLLPTKHKHYGYDYLSKVGGATDADWAYLETTLNF